MYLDFLPSQLAMWEFEWLIELAWQYIAMTRNNLCIISISLVIYIIDKSDDRAKAANNLFDCLFTSSRSTLYLSNIHSQLWMSEQRVKNGLDYLISNLVTDYIQKRRGQALLFSFLPLHWPGKNIYQYISSYYNF